MCKIIDAHLHINHNNNFQFKNDYIFFLNSINQEEWIMLKDLFNKNNNIIPFFGIHPWFINDITESWFYDLEQIIKSDDRYYVGEIGLDKIMEKKHGSIFSMDKQVEIFKKQLVLSKEYNRPVAIHCVKAWDLLFEILEEVKKEYKTCYCGILHYFNSSSQIMNKVIDYGFHVSFFPDIYKPNRQKVLDAFKKCPLDKILLETDVESGNNYDLINMHYENACGIRNIDIKELKRIIYNNGKIFTDKIITG